MQKYKKCKKLDNIFCRAIIFYLHIKSFSSCNDETILSIICLQSEEARRHNRQCR